MKTFSEILHEKYGLSASESEQLLAQMERLTYRKGEHIVREGERNSSLYLVAQGIWRGHYLRDGVDISLWFASEGDTLFSSWSYVADRPSLTSIEAISDSTVFRISKQKMETFFRLFHRLCQHRKNHFRTAVSGHGKLDDKRRSCTGETTLPCPAGAESGIAAACPAKAHRLLSDDYASVAQPHTGGTEQKEITE